MMRCKLLRSLTPWLVPAVVGAQTVRGVVVDPAQRPVAGVVVLLLDAASNEAARALSNERGEFRVSAASAGTYTVRTLRIGFRPYSSSPVSLKAGEEVTQQLVLAGVVFSLDTVRSLGKATCRMVARDSAVATWAVWEQVRAALTAAQLTANARAIGATTVSYDRTLDVSKKRIVKQTANVRSDIVTQPWRPSPLDSLKRFGYVVNEADGLVSYRAPGLDVLLSPAFLADHCVRLVASPDPTRLGVAFEPNTSRRYVPEIRGTLWLDRKSSELRRMEYAYVNVPKDVEENAGGTLEFARMRNGTWAITRWNIRMPLFVERFAETFSSNRKELGLAGIQVRGGELVLVTSVASRGKDTLWSRPPLVLAGGVVDSVSGKAVPNAHVLLSGTLLEGVTNAAGRFSIAGVMPGNYVVETRTPSLDSLNAVNESQLVFTDSAAVIEIRVPTGGQIAAQLCGTGRQSASGIVVGSVGARTDSLSQRNVLVVAEWTDISIMNDPSMPVLRTQKVSDTRTDARGAFRFCGMPVNTQMAFRATADSAAAAPVSIRIPPDRRFARVDLVLDRQVVAPANFFGTVLTDSTKEPIVNAEVSLPELSITGLTNEKGEFRLGDIPAGVHQVRVRHLGYGQLDTRLPFAVNQQVKRTVFLSKVVVLDSVLVKAAMGLTGADRLLLEFAENKARGLGHFTTREELERMEGRNLGSVMQQAPGLDAVRGRGTQLYVIGKRGPMSKCVSMAGQGQELIDQCLRQEGLYYVPDAGESKQGILRACYAQVYVDRVLMNPGRPTGPFNLNDFAANQIEAIEWYASATEVPAKYFGRQADCGLLVIHTRR